MIQFIKTPDPENEYEVAEIRMVIQKSGVNLSTLVNEFSGFLKAIGYHFDDLMFVNGDVEVICDGSEVIRDS